MPVGIRRPPGGRDRQAKLGGLAAQLGVGRAGGLGLDQPFALAELVERAAERHFEA